jgi:hypothetical protein
VNKAVDLESTWWHSRDQLKQNNLNGSARSEPIIPLFLLNPSLRLPPTNQLPMDLSQGDRAASQANRFISSEAALSNSNDRRPEGNNDPEPPTAISAPALGRTRSAFKKAKLKNEGTVVAVSPAPCYLQRMPFELLAMILKNTSSPRDVLAMARCNKYYCAILVGSAESMRIWKEVRRNADIPDPTPNFTESSYAAFLFDGGECEVGGLNLIIA